MTSLSYRPPVQSFVPTFLQRVPLRFNAAILLSLLAHTLLLSITLGGQTFGLPGLNFPWKERRLEASDLQVRLAAAQPAAAAAAAPPETPLTSSALTSPVDQPAVASAPTAMAMSSPANREAAGVVIAAPAPPAPAPLPEPATMEPKRTSPPEPVAPATQQVIAAAPSLARQAPAQVNEPIDQDAASRKKIEQETVARALEQARLERERQSAEQVRQAALVVSAQREAARLDVERQELAREENRRQEALLQERVRQDEKAQQVTARQELDRAEAARREASRQELARQAQLEASRQAQLEAARQDAIKQEAARRDATRQETARQEAIAQEAARQNIAKQAAARQEVERAEAARVEASRREANRQEQTRQAQLEAARQTQLEAARQDAIKQEAARQDAIAQEAARQNAVKQEAARQERARQELAQRERTEQEAAREERLRAIGKQLNAEAAQRDTAANRPSRSLLPGASGLRRGWLFGRADANNELVQYAEAMGRKIELNQTFDMVREAVKQPHARPMVTVSVRADGSVEKVTFDVSSGVAAIDEAIRKVVASQAPFPAFPPAIARQYDVIEIRRTWSFDTAIRLQ